MCDFSMAVSNNQRAPAQIAQILTTGAIGGIQILKMTGEILLVSCWQVWSRKNHLSYVLFLHLWMMIPNLAWLHYFFCFLFQGSAESTTLKSCPCKWVNVPKSGEITLLNSNCLERVPNDPQLIQQNENTMYNQWPYMKLMCWISGLCQWCSW